tara:strand:- start:190 stop:429 length:240 start_codon:yes stop_codon:yes gene_type:complete
MTVSELISLLKDMPQDSPVVIRGYEAGVDDVSCVEEADIYLDVNKEWYYGSHELISDSRKTTGKEAVSAVRLSAAGVRE